MEEVSTAVALPFRIGSSSMEITRIKLITDAAATGMLSDPMVVLSSSDENIEGSSCNGDEGEIATLPGSDDDDLASVTSLGPEMSMESSGSFVSDGSSVAGNCEDSFSLPSSETGTPRYGDVEKNAGILVEAAMDVLNVCMSDPEIMVPEIVEPAVQASRGGGRSVFLIDYVPLWGCASVCGRRPEMEDAFVALPHFYEIPLWMLIGNQVIDGLDPDLIRLPAHFFGVYDGHGGAQVADYCRKRVHQALIEQLGSTDKGCLGSSGDWKKYWEKAFVDCFQKVDDEVGGKASIRSMVSPDDVEMDGHISVSARMQPVAPETVGSTAVVAVICSSHIIVANCGDSRAVLYRGKQAVPLSVDHKPNREDEYARIEAQGGKVIRWNGYRVFGVLAMSRSIGDRYLEPWIIPEPEVTIVARTRDDECLILASDGLWDVLSNEEVCEVARKRILLWHKKNSATVPSAEQKGEWADPAAQAAADHLSKLAIQRGSKDNITVIVIDLKAQRKFKSKT